MTQETKLPTIGIACYASQGGSGIVATELGLLLARTGYEVHFISRSLPWRLTRYEKNVFYHQVEVANYPVFQHPPYTLSLATVMSEVARDHGLDILHVHYAIPHAASAFLAREMVGADLLTSIAAGSGNFSSSFEPDPGAVTELASFDFVGANDLTYWRNSVVDRVFYQGEPFEPRLSIDPATATVVDEGPWSAFVAATPDRIWVDQTSPRKVTNPWFNI